MTFQAPVSQQSGDITASLDLMAKLVGYRYEKALHHQLMKASECSMLSIDVLVLIYHFAKVSAGDILEIGSFVGGSTIAAALGVRDSAHSKKIVSIEVGGALKDHRLATRNIFKTLNKNLTRFGVRDAVTLMNGLSFDEKTISAVRAISRPGEIGLFIFDADANMRRDIGIYGDRLADRCWMVIDDYFSASDKGGPTRTQVDELIAGGRLIPLGFYGWGTWIGQWRQPPSG